MRIRVSGWFDKGNVGDEAYKVAYPLLFPGHDFAFGATDAYAPDLEILGGGDVVREPYTREIREDVPCVVASVSLTDTSDFDFLRRRAAAVYVRDGHSLRLAHARGVDASLAPDFAFALTPDADRGGGLAGDIFGEAGKDLYDRLVVVVVSSYLMHAGLDALARDFHRFLQVSQDLADVLDATEASVLFVPFGTRDPCDDRASNAFVASRCKWHGKHCVVHAPLGVQGTLDVIAAADAVVSSRLHASIFATVAATPFVDITHHSKNAGYLETIGRPELSVPFWDFGRGAFGDKLRLRLADDGHDSGLMGVALDYSRQLHALRLF